MYTFLKASIFRTKPLKVQQDYDRTTVFSWTKTHENYCIINVLHSLTGAQNWTSVSRFNAQVTSFFNVISCRSASLYFFFLYMLFNVQRPYCMSYRSLCGFEGVLLVYCTIYWLQHEYDWDKNVTIRSWFCNYKCVSYEFHMAFN